MIDEVDSATNNQVFLDFLAQLRGYYINRSRFATFQSVILAGEIYDYTSGYPHLVSRLCQLLDERKDVESSQDRRG